MLVVSQMAQTHVFAQRPEAAHRHPSECTWTQIPEGFPPQNTTETASTGVGLSTGPTVTNLCQETYQLLCYNVIVTEGLDQGQEANLTASWGRRQKTHCYYFTCKLPLLWHINHSSQAINLPAKALKGGRCRQPLTCS